MLKVHSKSFGSVAILHLQGRIVTGQTELLRNVVKSLSNVSTVVLDLAQVNTVDAAGLGLMLELREESQLRGIAFKLMNITNLVGRVFEITRLNSVFEVTSCTEVWLASYHQASPSVELARCA